MREAGRGSEEEVKRKGCGGIFAGEAPFIPVLPLSGARLVGPGLVTAPRGKRCWGQSMAMLGMLSSP